MPNSSEQDFLSLYLDYVADTECPKFFHRWACLSMVGAYLGRNTHFKLGHFDVYPNLYCMFIGSPGTRKSTAIKLAKSILSQTGYNTFSAEKTTKEKFLLDLSGDTGEEFSTTVKGKSAQELLEQNIFGDTDTAVDAEMYIAADEFNDFIGVGNIEFISLLGSLWDYKGTYTNRIKNGKSVSIKNPTISILGGNTPTGFALAFPADIIGQGFFSRLLLVYGEPTGRKITFPKIPSTEKTVQLVRQLQKIKSSCVGVASLTTDAEVLLETIYTTYQGVDDVRFESYSNRRFTHLLKLCILCAAIRYTTVISKDDVVYANTILTHTEHLMPKALGEFGKSKHSEVAHKIMQLLDGATAIVLAQDIWKHVHNDLEKFEQLTEILGNLRRAEKIQFVGNGFLAHKKVMQEHSDGTVDYSLLTAEERSYVN